MSSSERPEKRKRIKTEAPDEKDFDRWNASHRDLEQERRPIATNDRLELATLCQKYGLKMIQRRADTIGTKDSKRFRQELQLVGGFVGRDCPIFVSSAHSKIRLAEDECAREALSWLTENLKQSFPSGWPLGNEEKKFYNLRFAVFRKLVRANVDPAIIEEYRQFLHEQNEKIIVEVRADFWKRPAKRTDHYSPESVDTGSGQLPIRERFLAMAEQLPDQALEELMALTGKMESLEID